MDYKDKYLRYKSKYLALKRIQIGGENSIDSLLKKLNLTIKNLDSGWNGDSYIVKNNKDEQLILKLERMDEYDEKQKFTSEYYRQIDFDNLVAKNNTDKFMVLEGHGIIENCVFSHSKTNEIINKASEIRKARFIRKNNQPNCYYLLYKPVLDGTFKSVKDEIKNNEELLLDFMIQIIESINIYRKLGFIHTDVNPTNIMFKKNKDTKYQWYWIDYGNITNNKYPDSLLDIERKKENPNYKTNMIIDLISIVRGFCMTINHNIANYNPINSQKKDFVNKIKENDKDKYTEITKYLPIEDDKTFFDLVFKILYPKEYAKHYNINYDIDEKEQLLKDKILLCIKHSNDKTYDELIKNLSDNSISQNEIKVGKSLFSINEQKLFNDNITKMAEKIVELKDKTKLINFINKGVDKKYTEKDFSTENNVEKILNSLRLLDLINIDNGEHFNIFKIKKPNIDKKDIEEYISEKKLELSYSINNNGKIITNTKDEIYAMHSIGKVFTGFLIMLLLNEDIITSKDINAPLQLDKKVRDKLPKIILDRLEETTMLDVMTHMAGLTNYLSNYMNELSKNNKENPIEPEDFIKYINPDVKEKNKFNYSNTGLLLCGLSVKHLYNKKLKENKSYNQILEKYIIKPAELKTFSISKPEKAVFNKNGVSIAEFLNGSPAGGYWISPDDLAKFGVFILEQVKEKPKIEKYLEEYGGEFYDKNMVSHSGGINGSNCWLTVYLKHNISVAIMDNNGKDSRHLKFAIDYYS